MNVSDRAARGLAPRYTIALETISDDGVSHRLDGLTVLDSPMPRGSIAGHHPELNRLLPLDYHDEISGAPVAKSIRCA